MSEPEEKPKMHSMTLRIPADWHEELRTKSFQERRDINDLVREALEKHFALTPCPPLKRGAKKKPTATQ
ncbi:MAG: hypothetical protein ACO1SX_10680 [Actinomycetota bacterium]